MKINIKKVILFIIISTALILGGVWLFGYFQNSNQGEETPGGLRNLFPFGEIFSGSRNEENSQNIILDENGNPVQQVDGEEDVVNATRPQLQLITNKPTGGFVALTRITQEEVLTETTLPDGTTSQQSSIADIEQSLIRYSDINSGTIYETALGGENAFNEVKVIDNVIPNAEHSFFSANGNHVAFQYWDEGDREIETYLATISLLSYQAEPCGYSFEGTLVLGEESEFALNLHRFLNLVPETQLASSGINSLGNESPLVTQSTFDAISRFQTVHNLSVDGSLGPQTRSKMIEVCNLQEEQKAKERFENSDTKYEIFGSFLPEGIVSLSMHPLENKLFFLEKSASGILGNIYDLMSQERKTVFTSPFTEWLSYWNIGRNVELVTKPSYGVEGYSYNLNIDNGDYKKSFRERKGLMVLPSPDDKKLLVFDTEQGRPSLSIYERELNRFLPLSIQTFIDKCVWSTTSEYLFCGVPDSFGYGDVYPDTWYQGLETYSDSLWRIDATTLEEEVLSDMVSDYSLSIDIEKINIDRKNEFLFFIDKNSEFLWSYRIEE